MTLKELIIENTNASFDLMTPGGYVFLTPEKAQALLAGQDVVAHAGDSESSRKITAEELLPQEIVNINAEEQLFHALTDNPHEIEPGLEMEVRMC